MKNTKVDLFGTEYKIKYMKECITDDGTPAFGLTDFSSHIIYIGESANGVKQSPSEMKLTLLHELMHAILQTGQYNTYCEDEPLVEWIARCINQCIKKNII